MRPSKIVLIGAGSASFGLNTLASLLREKQINGSTLTLVDVNEPGVEKIRRLAERMAAEWGREVHIESTTDRRKSR